MTKIATEPNSKAQLPLAPSGLFCRIGEYLEAIWKGIRPPKRKRLELKFLSYADADKLIRETNGAWTIAKEEDGNRCIGWVYLELLEEYPNFSAKEMRQNGQALPPATK